MVNDLSKFNDKTTLSEILEKENVLYVDRYFLQSFKNEIDKIILENQKKISSFLQFIEKEELLTKASEFIKKDKKKCDVKEYFLFSIV